MKIYGGDTSNGELIDLVLLFPEIFIHKKMEKRKIKNKKCRTKNSKIERQVDPIESQRDAMAYLQVRRKQKNIKNEKRL